MTKAIALFVPATSDFATVQPFTVGDESYKMLQTAVGGWFDCVHIAHGIDMWVNDEGLINGSPMNAFATMAYWHAYRSAVLQAFIYGDVIFTSSDGMGETTGLTVEQFDFLGRMLDDLEIKIDLSLMVS